MESPYPFGDPTLRGMVAWAKGGPIMALGLPTSKELIWRQRIERWQQSQLSVRVFCRRHRLSEPSFYGWRRMLLERGMIAAAEAKALPAFVPIRLEQGAGDAARTLEVVLAEGRVVRVRPGFDAATLRQLVEALEEPSC